MKRFYVNNDKYDMLIAARVTLDMLVEFDQYYGICMTPFTLTAFQFKTKTSAEMFVRFLGTLTDSKMSIVEVER